MREAASVDLRTPGSGDDGTYGRQELTSSHMILVMMESEIDTDLVTHDSGNDGTYVRQVLTSSCMVQVMMERT